MVKQNWWKLCTLKCCTATRTQFTPREVSIRRAASLRANGGTTYSSRHGTFQLLPRSKCSWYHMLRTRYGPIQIPFLFKHASVLNMQQSTAKLQVKDMKVHPTGTPQRLLNTVPIMTLAAYRPNTGHTPARCSHSNKAFVLQISAP